MIASVGGPSPSGWLLCLNAEWQGCESPELGSGARAVAGEVFGDRDFVDFGAPACADLAVRDRVFALDCVTARFERVLDRLEAEAPPRVFTIAGTCGAGAAPVAYLARRYDDLGVVWLDAHGDLNTPESSPSGHFHGMVLRTLLGEGPAAIVGRVAPPLDPRRVVLAGVRDLDAPERDHAGAAGVGLVEGWPLDVAPRVVGFLRASGARRLYVHVDVDVFDPGSFGDALFSVPGGPSPASAAAAVREIVAEFELVGVGVVESCGRRAGAARDLAAFLVGAGLWPPVDVGGAGGQRAAPASGPAIATERLTLTPLGPRDAEALFAYRSLPEVRRYQMWQPSGVDDAARFIAASSGECGTPGEWFQMGIRPRGSERLIGDVGLHFLERGRGVEIGFTLDPSAQGRGFGTEAVRGCVRYLFENTATDRVVASVDPRNERSMRLLERVGMRQESRTGQADGSGDAVFAISRETWQGAGV